MEVKIRPITLADADACGRIIYEAFKAIQETHRFAFDIPSIEAGIQLALRVIAHPSIFGVAAESGRRLIGSNFLDERDPVRSVGPITVDPRFQNRGVGRGLMQAVLERARGAVSIRLLQEGYHMRSMSLYANLGFEVKEPIVMLTGAIRSKPVTGVQVRRLCPEDLDECGALCRRVHNFERTNELKDALTRFKPFVAVRAQRIVAYASALASALAGHGVAEGEEDMRALFLGAADQLREPLSILLPVRQASFHRWCLGQGMRAIKPFTLMTIGEYQEPRGCWFPSVSY